MGKELGGERLVCHWNLFLFLIERESGGCIALSLLTPYDMGSQFQVFDTILSLYIYQQFYFDLLHLNY